MSSENNNTEDPFINYSNEQKEEAFSLLTELLKTREGKKAVLDNCAKGLITGTSTYYKRKHAEEIIGILDDMIANRQPYEFCYADMAQWYKPETVWLKINQAVKYIIDHMDPDKRYLKLRQEIQIHRRSKTGVSLEFIQINSVPNNTPSLIARKITKEEVETIMWKANIIKFVEKDKPAGEQLILEDLHLLDDDRGVIDSLFEGNDDYVVDYSTGWPNKINIIFDPAPHQIPRGNEEGE